MAAQNNSDDILLYLNDREAERKVPVMIYLCIVAFFGLIGNIHVLAIYSLKYGPSNFKCFVMCLAILDTIACVLSMPFEILVMRYPYMFFASGACATFRYINTVVAAGSVMILVVIGAERFRKICRPFMSQLSIWWAKAVCVLTVFIALLLCIPAAVSNGRSTINLEHNITGIDCGVRDSIKSSNFLYVNAGFGMVTFIVATICLIVMYTSIGITLSQHKKRMTFRLRSQIRHTKSQSNCQSSENTYPSTSDEELSISAGQASDTCITTLTSETLSVNMTAANPDKQALPAGSQQSEVKFNNSIPSQDISRTNRSPGCKISSKTVNESTSKITSIFVLITVVFVLSFIPHIILACVVAINKDFVSSLSETEDILYRIAMRLYFLNNAVNPVIYSVFGSDFRYHCKMFYKSVFCVDFKS